MVLEERKLEKRAFQIKAIWKTLQGEGLFAGRPAVFIRMVGCNLWSGYEGTRERDSQRNKAECPKWCDTEFTKEGSQSYDAVELAQAILEVGKDTRFCVLTGGEPLLQVNADLIEALHSNGFFVAIETNGTVSLQDSCWSSKQQKLIPPDWIVCSPKLQESALKLEYFDELKLIVPNYLPEQFSQFCRRQRSNYVQGSQLPLLWLQPEDGAHVREATQLAVNIVLENPLWRVSVQTHKILEVE
ncbi:7-carboxy-7-deazaguanine synthase QueE [Spirosoma spitsbergense]|uniref:7-carboxy-7-deazaguanine synthase QueE n=1 Tax=Spirosoma spitsbergense TaxID=431554 RepID=UPI00037598D4|nr:7-carboxy-7-deazaguanine synthase QueE [Spirosoma spitsbergense]